VKSQTREGERKVSHGMRPEFISRLTGKAARKKDVRWGGGAEKLVINITVQRAVGINEKKRLTKTPEGKGSTLGPKDIDTRTTLSWSQGSAGGGESREKNGGIPRTKKGRPI